MLGSLADALTELVDEAAEAVAGFAGFGSCCDACAKGRSGKIGNPDDAATGTIDVAPYAHARSDLVKYYEIPEGEAGTKATLEWMAKLAREAAKDPKFVQIARSIVRDLHSKDYQGEMARLLDYVKTHVRYVLDPHELEWVQTPMHTLCVEGQGDCDDGSTLLVGLALALGHGGAFVTYAADPRRPDDWSHVAAVLAFRKKGQVWCGVADFTQPESYLGWEPPARRIFKRKIWWVEKP